MTSLDKRRNFNVHMDDQWYSVVLSLCNETLSVTDTDTLMVYTDIFVYIGSKVLDVSQLFVDDDY